MKPSAEIGVFGGSGFYTLGDNPEQIWMETPYGMPSDRITLATIEGHKVAFLPRHGHDHRYPPAQVPYRANLWAMKELGVGRIIGPCAAGSLSPDVKPGEFVICDQFVDRTSGRQDTFYQGPFATHISAADPYCPQLRSLAISTARELKIPVHESGTMVVIQGPRFSTRAESRWFSSMGWQVINMTGYPEAILARELEICYVNISLITDYDAGLEGKDGIEPVSHEEVLRVFSGNIEKIRALITGMLKSLPSSISCGCHSALKTARG